MPDILTARCAPVLRRFADSAALLAFDYDGTLAPIAATPRQARMRSATRRLVVEAARRYPCVVISGRALDDISARVHGIPLVHVFGNHGAEPSAQDDARARLVGGWVEQLEQRLARWPGVIIEDKTHSATIHYRLVRDRSEALAAIHRAIAGLPRARAVEGVEAVNLLAPGADKGAALQRARVWCRCDAAIYVGDDGTDEDAFRSAGARELLGIRVGRSTRSCARYWIDTQIAIDRLLLQLIRLRGSPP